MSLQIEIGRKVTMKTFQLLHQKGVVRYVGPVEGLPSIQLGIELEQPKGKHNGSYNGSTYFECAPNHGVFATLSQVKPLAEIVQPPPAVMKEEQKQQITPSPITKSPMEKPSPSVEKEEKKEVKEEPLKLGAPSQLTARRSLKPPSGLKRPAERSRTPTKLPLAKSSSRLQAPPQRSVTKIGAGSDSSKSVTASGTQSPATKISLTRADSSLSTKPASKQEIRKMATSTIAGRQTQRGVKDKPVTLQLKSQSTKDIVAPKSVVPQPLPSPLPRKKPPSLGLSSASSRKTAKMNISKNTSTTFEFSDQEKSASPQRTAIKPKHTPLAKNTPTSGKKEVSSALQKRREIGGRVAKLNLEQKKSITKPREDPSGVNKGVSGGDSWKTKVEELENQLKVLKEEKIKEIAKAKSEVQSREKVIENLKETHLAELKRQQDELNAKFREAMKRKENEDMLKERLIDIEELKRELERAKKAQEKAEGDAKRMEDQIEELRTELESEREEKDELRVKLEQCVAGSSEGAGSDETGSYMSQEELKQENERLKTALRQISGQMEMEKATRGQELIEAKDELKRVERLKSLLAEKEQDINLLLEELDEKEKQLTQKEIEVKALQQNIDSNSDLDLMVEELTNNILQKEEEVEQLKAQIATLKEDMEVEEEATNEAQKLADILQSQVMEKEAQIKREQQERLKMQGRTKELEELVARFREKVVDLSTEREQLHSKLADSTEGELKLKLHEVMEKQSYMYQQLRQANRKEVAYRYSQIRENQTRIKNEWMESLLPQKVVKYAKIDTFEKVRLVETLKAKTYLLLHELQSSCFLSRGKREIAKIEGTDPHLFFRWSCDLFYNSSTLLDVLLHIGFVMSGLELNRYDEINEAEWGNLRAAESFLDNFIKLAKEQSLTPTISLTPYTSTIGAIQDFYMTKLADHDATNPPKLSSRNGLVLIKLAVLGLVRTSRYLRQISSYRERALMLLKLIEDVIARIDLIPASNSGSAFILIEHGLGKKLETKFEFAEILWRESSNDDDSDGAASYDWGAWLEAIERDIWGLSKSTEFRKIEDDGNNDPCSVFLHTQLASGPWTIIAERVKEELEKAASKNERIKELTDKISEIRLAWRKCQQELKDTLILKIQLQRKAGELNQRAMRIPALEDQNARLNENVTQYQNQLVECRAAIERLSAQNKELASVQPVTMPTPPVMRAQNRRLETMAQPVGQARGFDFIPRTVIGDRGIIKEYRELVKCMLKEKSNAQYERSYALLKRINHNCNSSFNRFMASRRPQKAKQSRELKRRLQNIEERINKVKESQGSVRILRISQNPYDPIRAYRTQHQEQLKELYKAKQEINEFNEKLHSEDAKLLQILTQEVLVLQSKQ